jgi:peptidoglycan/LPS O-acetylase OafA/YrhL
MVFFFHTGGTELRPPLSGATLTFSRIALWGGSGVDIFFVLSGFLITSLLYRDRSNPRFYKDFYWKRALRILPVYLTFSLLTLAANHQVALFVLSLFFLSNFSTALHFPFPGPLWTLAIEEQFYLIWPTIVRRRDLSQLRVWAIGIALTAVVLRILFALKGYDNYMLTFLHCDSLAVGALLACHFGGASVWITTRRKEQIAFAGLFVLGIVLLLLAAWMQSKAPAVSLEVMQQKPPFFAMGSASHQTGIVLLAGCVIGFVIANRGSAWLTIFRSRVLTFFGLISYALYMVHLDVVRTYDRVFGWPSSSNFGQVLLRIFIALSVTVLVCVGSRYLLELPAMSLRKRVLSHRSQSAETEDPPLPLANM